MLIDILKGVALIYIYSESGEQVYHVVKLYLISENQEGKW